ncbi:sensor histidine kinase [Azoarcus communis]|uniref:ATP-binding protein n=1 Tax=Parazoarcus communis TaxID=41977 RepID=UPI0014596BE4|nr:ATP-binding protein [Parazoarcus communis]NMG47821.1 sensor histidine kinase [Parazoarcus communis]
MTVERNPPAPGDGLAPVRTDRLRLLHLRWLSVLAMLVLSVLVFPLLAPAHPREPLQGVALVLVGINLGLLAGAARWLQGRWGAFVQILTDLAAWGAFLYFSGGVTNPAISLLLPLVAVGAYILPSRQSWMLFALAVVEYSLLWHFHHPVQLLETDAAMHWHLAGMWLSFVFSGLTVVWFVSRLNAALRAGEQALAEARSARARDDYVLGLGQLAAGAAHRLGTPLGTLRIVADGLACRQDLAPDVREDIELMRAQVDQCRDILHALTHEAGLARAERGGVVAAAAWVDRALGRWQQMRPLVRLNRQTTSPLADRFIAADASLDEVLHNLIDNAANASQRAGAEGQGLDLEVRVHDGRLWVDIADRGEGLPSPLLSAAQAGPFGPGVERQEGQGMGVGLLLARAVVDRHGGRLDFLPRAGGGTIARVSIPLCDLDR